MHHLDHEIKMRRGTVLIDTSKNPVERSGVPIVSDEQLFIYKSR